MLVPSHLVWLAHVLPAVALTVTAPATTPSTPATTCGSENLVKEGSFEGVNLDDGVWNVVGKETGIVIVNYLCVLNVIYPCIFTN